MATSNSQLVAGVKAMQLKEEPPLFLFVEQPDFSLLHDLVKNGVTWKIRSEAHRRLEEKQ